MNGLDQDRYIDVGQIRSIGLVGVLEEEYWESIRTALNIVLEFSL
jgi:mRNA interferase MazF